MIRPFYGKSAPTKIGYMKIRTISITIVAGLFMLFVPFAGATQADDTTITINGHTPGVTPFISNLSLTASNTTDLKSIQFTIEPKPGSVTRPLSGTYANYYLVNRGFENPQSGDITLPVYGLYAGRANAVTLTYRFQDGSSKQAHTTITTAAYDDQCGYNNATLLQPRTDSTDLSYDYIFIMNGGCGNNSPVIIDTDNEVRWVSPTSISFALTAASLFINNAVYETHGPTLSRVDLDGTITVLGNYSNTLGSGDRVENFHHNIDPGKTGALLEADTTAWYESVVMEVDFFGNVLKTWNLADVISAAMTAGGDDPSQFVFQRTPGHNNDWFHNNAVTYNRADDSLVVSSRENFVIAIDYETGAIKWILGDPTKYWYQFPSLRQFALRLAPGSLAPIGQHGLSIPYDEGLLLHDNGLPSGFPVFSNQPGQARTFSSPRKYQLNLNTKVATEVWNYEQNQSVYSPICSCVYEDAPLNYLINFSSIGLGTPTVFDKLLGLNSAGENSAGETIFYYQYTSTHAPGTPCQVAYNARPIHLENTKFPAVQSRVQNLSSRGTVMSGDNVLINGFVVTGPGTKTVVVRALGPSLGNFGLSGVLADPVLTVYNSSGEIIESNDNWQTNAGATFIAQNGLAPSDPSEAAAVVANLAPGAYTVVVTGNNSTEGISLAEVYEIFRPGGTAKLANVSGRSFVGTGDNALVSGFIVGDVGSATVVVRALGRSLASFGVSNPLSNPVLTIYDSKGSVIASNDNWQRDPNNVVFLPENGLAPPNPFDSALVLHLPAGEYTAIVSGANGATGNALVEVYQLP
jgi:arylsulfate sulfotransferase